MNTLDLSGLKCPLPVLRTQKAMRAMKSGERITIIATDPMAAIDIPHFCNEQGHHLLESQRSDNSMKFTIEKA